MPKKGRKGCPFQRTPSAKSGVMCPTEGGQVCKQNVWGNVSQKTMIRSWRKFRRQYWQELDPLPLLGIVYELETDEESEMVLPASEVLSLIQHTICLIGNAPELISQCKCSKILESIDSSWSRYGSDIFPTDMHNLFGDDFQAYLTKAVGKDSALSKAVSIT